MARIRRFLLRLSNVFRPGRAEPDLARELSSHLTLIEDDFLRRGLTPQEARRAARRAFGGVEQAKDRHRDARSFLWLDDLRRDVQYAVRTLSRTPAFTAVAILTLALGVGANTAIFSFVDSVLLKPLPYPDSDRIVRVLQKRPNGDPFPVTTLDFLDWQKENTVFEFLAAQRGFAATLTSESGETEPALLNGVRVSAGYYEIWGITPLLGRTFRPDEDEYGKDRVVILTHELWVTRFGADPAIVGRAIRLDNAPHTVVGVLPPGADDRQIFQFAKPMAFAPFEMTRGLHWLGAFARLKPGVTIEQARAHMEPMAARFEREYPFTNNGFGVAVERFADIAVPPLLRTNLYVLLAAAGMVLLIGCANLANLTLARGIAREREVVVRASLGAGRGRLVRQLLTENLLLSVAGGAAGVGLGYLTMRVLKVVIPPFNLPAEANVQLDARVLIFALTISVLTGLVFGLAPALHVTKPDLTGGLKEGGRGSRRGGRLRNALVVAEVAVAFVLLTGAGLLIRSFFTMQNLDLGFNSSGVLTMGLPTPQTQYPDMDRLRSYLREVRSAVESVPGVEETALTAAVPLRGTGYRLPMQLAGTEPVPRPKRGLYFYKLVSPSYFRVFGVQLRMGRAFDDGDRSGGPPVVVINERLATRLFPDGSPIGQRILIPQILLGKPDLGDDVAHEIVGVVANERMTALTDVITEGVYGSIEQNVNYNPTLAVRAAVAPQTLEKSIRYAVDQVNRSQVLTNVKTMDRIKSESIVGNRVQMSLLAVFSGVALLLAAIGIYGVISYSVAQRTHEIGIRAALGASTGSLLQLVLGSGLALTLVGLMLGLLGSLALTRLLETILFGVGARDPLTMVFVAVTLVAVSVLACYVPARRATRIAPLVALRHQ